MTGCEVSAETEVATQFCLTGRSADVKKLGDSERGVGPSCAGAALREEAQAALQAADVPSCVVQRPASSSSLSILSERGASEGITMSPPGLPPREARRSQGRQTCQSVCRGTSWLLRTVCTACPEATHHLGDRLVQCLLRNRHQRRRSTFRYHKALLFFPFRKHSNLYGNS